MPIINKLSLRQTMQELDCSRSNIYKLIEHGVLTAYRFPGFSKIYFDIDEINNSFEPTNDTNSETDPEVQD